MRVCAFVPVCVCVCGGEGGGNLTQLSMQNSQVFSLSIFAYGARVHNKGLFIRIHLNSHLWKNFCTNIFGRNFITDKTEFDFNLADLSCLECRWIFLAACAEERDNSGSDKLGSSICEMAADAECAINCGCARKPQNLFCNPTFRY